MDNPGDFVYRILIELKGSEIAKAYRRDQGFEELTDDENDGGKEEEVKEGFERFVEESKKGELFDKSKIELEESTDLNIKND